jgi:hypothetical protein
LSVITSIMISVGFHHDDAQTETNRMEIDAWLQDRRHFPVTTVEDGGGEKSMCCTLFLGSFNLFDTEEFAKFVYGLEWPDVSRIQVFAMEIDREESYIWKEVKRDA